MGASTFETHGYGKTPLEAFQKAVEEAQYLHGHDGYTGTIAEKESFVLIPVPEEYKARPMDYAYKLMEDDDERIEDKWGPAGCVLVKSEELWEDVPYATTTEKYKQEGARKWETIYALRAEGNYYCEAKSQTEAEAIAKTYAKTHNITVTISIEKKLVNGDERIITVTPKTKRQKSTERMNEYFFFGWASS